jgi:hypothetical protein
MVSGEMRCRVVTAFALTIGTMATFGSAYLGWSSGHRRAGENHSTPEASRRVVLGSSRLLYFEGDNVLTLAAETASGPDGVYYVAPLPGEAIWLKEMPNWCRKRRAEVVAEIKSLTVRERIKWTGQTRGRVAHAAGVETVAPISAE